MYYFFFKIVPKIGLSSNCFLKKSGYYIRGSRKNNWYLNKIEKRARLLITLVVFSILIGFSIACGEATATSEIETIMETTQTALIPEDATPTPMISDDLIDKVDKMVYWYGGGQVIYEITVTEDLAKIIVEKYDDTVIESTEEISKTKFNDIIHFIKQYNLSECNNKILGGDCIGGIPEGLQMFIGSDEVFNGSIIWCGLLEKNPCRGIYPGVSPKLTSLFPNFRELTLVVNVDPTAIPLPSSSEFDKIIFSHEYGDSRNYTIIIDQSSASLVYESHGEIVNESKVILSKDRFIQLFYMMKKNYVRLCDREGEDAPCEGGTTEKLELNNGNITIFSGSVYHCREECKSTSPCKENDTGDLCGNISIVRTNMEGLFPNFDELTDVEAIPVDVSLHYSCSDFSESDYVTETTEMYTHKQLELTLCCDKSGSMWPATPSISDPTVLGFIRNRKKLSEIGPYCESDTWLFEGLKAGKSVITLNHDNGDWKFELEVTVK